MRSISPNSRPPEGFNLPVDGLPAGSSIMQGSSGVVVHRYYLGPLSLPPKHRETEPTRVRRRIPRVQFGPPPPYGGAPTGREATAGAHKPPGRFDSCAKRSAFACDMGAVLLVFVVDGALDVDTRTSFFGFSMGGESSARAGGGSPGYWDPWTVLAALIARLRAASLLRTFFAISCHNIFTA